MSTANKPGRALIYPNNDFLRRSAFVAAIRVVGLLCVFILQVLLARLVDNDVEFGKYAWGQSLLFMAGALACLGLPGVTGRFIASLSVDHNEQAIAAIITRARALLLRSSAALVMVALLLALFWPESSDERHYRNIAILALLLAPAVSFSNLYQDLSRARQWQGLALLPFFVFRPALTGIFALCLWGLYQGDISGEAVLGLAGLSFISVVIVQIQLYRRREKLLAAVAQAPGATLDYHPSRLFRTALPMFFTRCAGLIITYSNVLLVGFLAGPAAAGVYFAAERLAQLAAIPLSVVSSVNQQAMAAAHATDDPDRLQKITTQSAHGSLWPTLVVGIGLVVLAKPLLQLFGDDFASAQLVLIALVASNTIAVLLGPAQDVLLMTGRQKYFPKVMFLSAAVHVISLCLLVPQIGALGAAFSSITSGLVANIWMMSLAKRETGINTTIMGFRSK
jgi:O-antigen/teichoic acid export membrane protein